MLPIVMLWIASRPRPASDYGNEPPLDIQQNPVFLDVGAYRFHQESMINLIEGRLDVELHHPVILPTPCFGDSNRLFCRFPGPVSI
jgi:hypothetical protein